MDNCLDVADLVRMVEGTLPEALAAQAAAHAQCCAVCQQAIQRHRADANLFDEIKAAHGSQATGPVRDKTGLNLPAADAIPGYDILGELHRGGQGVVYKAVQKATKRVVALKVLLHGKHATPRERQRFEREIDLIAQFRHPHIVTIYDSGQVADRPYFAMEHIDGQRLDAYLQSKAPPLRERIDLFRRLCLAVAYAHQHGVIHRDLKPGNVIMDQAGQPHVLDFGLAKTAGDIVGDGAERLTHTGEFLGTLTYASPEQTQCDPHLIDTRTDVYALGVMLYEAITGAMPYETHGSLATSLANIAAVEPPAPSAKKPELDRDLDTIVLKALAKEPGRRYPSAEALARDLDAWLNGQPIDARRDSLAYLLGRSLRRYRWVVGTTVAFVVVALIALVVSLAYWRGAVVDRNRAEDAERDERLARADEKRQRQEAEWQAYVANLAAATASLAAHDVVDARLRLNLAPSRLRGWEWGLLHSKLDDSRATFSGHESYVEAVAFTPDGKQLASTSWDKTLRLWDAADGRMLATYQAPAETWALACHPQRPLFAIGCWDGCVRLWDATTRQVEAELPVAMSKVWAAEFSKDGAYLAAGFGGGKGPACSVCIWELATRKVVMTANLPNRLLGLTFHPDGQRLLTSTPKGIGFWNRWTGESLTKEGSPWSAPCVFMALDAKGEKIATGGPGMAIQVRDVTTGALLRTLHGHSQGVTALAFRPDGRQLASAARDKSIRLWNVDRGDEAAVLHGHGWTVSALAYHPDGRRLASGAWDKSIKLWNANDSGTVKHLRRHTGKVHGLAWHPDGKSLASAGNDGGVILGSLDGKTAWKSRHDEPVHAVAFDRAGARIAAALHDKSVQLYDVADGSLLRKLEGHKNSVLCVAFHLDGRLLASGGVDGALRLWDTASGACLHVAKQPGDHVHGTTFSPDGRWLASVGHKSMNIWDAATLEPLASFPRSTLQEEFTLAIHPDSRRVAAGIDEQNVAIWDVVAKKELMVLRGHSDEIYTLAFSPDGSRLITASRDGTVRIWDTNTGVELAKLRAGSQLTCLAFQPGGEYLAVGRDDGAVALWQGSPAAPSKEP